jgi:hypothetical protein
MATVTFNQTTCVNVTTIPVTLLPIGVPLWPNDAGTANGATYGLLAFPGVVYNWDQDAVIPPNYACALTVLSPQGGIMQCYSVGEEQVTTISVKVNATGERMTFPERAESSKKRSES